MTDPPDDAGERPVDILKAEQELFARRDVWRVRIMGINALGILHRHQGELLAILQGGGSVDVLLLDHHSDAFRERRDTEEMRHGRVANRLLKEMEASMAILRDILNILLHEYKRDIGALGQRFQVRFCDRTPTFSLLFVETEDGAQCLRRDLSPLPQVVVGPADGVLYGGGEAYQRNLRKFTAVWNEADPAPLNLLESDLVVVSPEKEDVPHIYAQAIDLHEQRRLDEASELYRTVLQLDKPGQPTEDQVSLARRFLPRVHTTRREPFDLRDLVVVIHPEAGRRLIGYHLMWEDDIDYLNDNDPADHEVVWIRYTEDGKIEGAWAFWHNQILTTARAVPDANAHGGRVRVNSQWGKHGSLLEGWREKIGIDQRLPAHPEFVTLEFTRLAKHRKAADGAYADRWPRRFEGDLADFTDFAVEIDMEKKLGEHDMIVVSRHANAVISQWYLPYNIRPKDDWPPDIAGPR